MENAAKVKKLTGDLTILYVENDLTLQKKVMGRLTQLFSNVHLATNGENATSQYKKYKPDIVLTDLNLSKKDSFEMIIDMQEINPKVSIIVLSYGNSNFELLKTLDLGIIDLLKKPLNMPNLNKAIHKVISLKLNEKKAKQVAQKRSPQDAIKKPLPSKPTKIKTPIIKQEKTKIIKNDPIIQTIEKPKITPKIKPQVIKKEKSKTKRPIEIKPSVIKKEEHNEEKINKPAAKKTEPIKKIEPISCSSILSTAFKNKNEISCINNYKGLIITHNATIISVNENLFTIQVSKTQFVSAIYEKQTIIALNHHHIKAKVKEVNKHTNILTLINPEIIKFKPRDNVNKRITVDKSFKATLSFNNTHAELTPLDISFDYITLESNEPLDLKENDHIDLTMGFEIDGPSSLINEKKFTKAFATGTIQRIQKKDDKQKIIIKHTIQKSGQNVYKKYLQQREMYIIHEFKMKMKS